MRCSPRPRGRTLELGAGTGLNLAHYTGRGHRARPHRARPAHGQAPARAARRAAAGSRHGRGDRGAGRGPALRRRQLRHRGRDAGPLHGRRSRRAPSPRSSGCWRRRAAALPRARAEQPSSGAGRWQDRLERPWGWIAGGCHPNRATDETLAEAGFWIERLEHAEMPGHGAAAGEAGHPRLGQRRLSRFGRRSLAGTSEPMGDGPAFQGLELPLVASSASRCRSRVRLRDSKDPVSGMALGALAVDCPAGAGQPGCAPTCRSSGPARPDDRHHVLDRRRSSAVEDPSADRRHRAPRSDGGLRVRSPSPPRRHVARPLGVDTGLGGTGRRELRKLILSVAGAGAQRASRPAARSATRTCCRRPRTRCARSQPTEVILVTRDLDEEAATRRSWPRSMRRRLRRPLTHVRAGRSGRPGPPRPALAREPPAGTV